MIIVTKGDSNQLFFFLMSLREANVEKVLVILPLFTVEINNANVDETFGGYN